MSTNRIFSSAREEIKKVMNVSGRFEAIRVGERNVWGFGGIRTAEDHLTVFCNEHGTFITYHTLNEWGEGGDWGFDSQYLIIDDIMYDVIDDEIDWDNGVSIDPEKAVYSPEDWGSRWHAMGVYLEIFG
jgi:hypothetical protein